MLPPWNVHDRRRVVLCACLNDPVSHPVLLIWVSSPAVLLTLILKLFFGDPEAFRRSDVIHNPTSGPAVMSVLRVLESFFNDSVRVAYKSSKILQNKSRLMFTYNLFS